MLHIRNSYRLLLSTALLVGILLLQFHYHDHEDATEHCPVCLIQEVFDIADAPALVILAFIPFIFIAFVEKSTSLPLYISLVKRSRAPPKHS